MTVASMATPAGGWCVLALDEMQGTFERIYPSHPTKDTQLNQFAQQTLSWLSPVVTGVVLDSTYGLSAITQKAKRVGVAFRIESSQSFDPLSVPPLEQDWGVEAIRANYGVVKLGLRYHPRETAALMKKQFVAEIADYCKYVGCELLIDLRLLPSSDEHETTAEATVAALQEFRSQAQLFVLDVPVDPLAAATITAELDVPWLVRLDQKEYGMAKENLRMCLEAGAKGAVVDQVIWSDLPNTPTQSQFEIYIQGEARDRLIEVRRIIDEATNHS